MPPASQSLAPVVTVDFDFDVWHAEIARMAREMRRTEVEQMTIEGRLLGVELMKVTPPFGSLSGRESFAAQRRIGREAVIRDIRRVFVSFGDFEFLKNPRNDALWQRMREMQATRDLAGIAAVFGNIGIPMPASRILPGDLNSIHDRVRGRTGRIRRRLRGRYLVAEEQRRALERRKLNEVNTAKSGWSPAARRLGASVPAAIASRAGRGRLIDRTDRPDDPVLILSNNVAYIRSTLGPGMIAVALRNRRGKLKNQLKHAIAANNRKTNQRI